MGFLHLQIALVLSYANHYHQRTRGHGRRPSRELQAHQKAFPQNPQKAEGRTIAHVLDATVHVVSSQLPIPRRMFCTNSSPCMCEGATMKDTAIFWQAMGCSGIPGMPLVYFR